MKKVLIIAYYWPPAGGPGVQRWLKFVKYLRDFDVEPVLYIPENPSYPIRDEDLVQEVPDDIQILKKPIFEPYSLAGIFGRKETQTISAGIIEDSRKQSLLQKVLLFIRGNFFIPDARKFWVRPSVKFLKQELEKQGFDTIITTGPPHSLHLIGLELKKDTGIRWIADFRDPWTQIGYHEKLKLTASSRKKHEKLEKKVLNAADDILVTSYTTREEFESKTNRPVHLITNGFDTEIEQQNTEHSEFWISHIGSLLAGRNPENLWLALSELLDENEDFRKKFRLKLAGRISDSVLESIQVAGLQEFLENKGYISHSEALKLQRQSSVLLLLEINSEETKGIIPGKVFEYLSANKPILAVGPANWDAEQILKKTLAGSVFQYHEKKAIKTYILSCFRGEVLQPDRTEIQQYHRRNLTYKLSEVIRK
ncbi:MAG: glycosyltransferase [Christiangramia sp.]|uniref:glycosyltransferase n=1 Tax=Christiangramia sp. TaxID=1931228 RepID=UPI003242E00E